MNIIVLAAGEEYTSSKDNNYPLCLKELSGRPVIQHISELIDFDKNTVLYIFQDKYIKKHHLTSIVNLLSSERAMITSVPENTAGAAASALVGAVSLKDLQQSLLIISSNQLSNINYNDFYSYMTQNNYDAGTVIFEAIHPRYSFVSLNDENLVIEASEKKPISKNATAGVYWFKTTSSFIDAVKNMIRKDARTDNKFYICPSLNEIILAGGRVGVYKINNESYYPTHHIEEYANESR